MSTNRPLSIKAQLQREAVARQKRAPIWIRTTWNSFIATVVDRMWTMMDGIDHIKRKDMYLIYPGMKPMNIMGQVWRPSTSVYLMDLAWVKGMKYTSTNRRHSIRSQDSIKKRRVGNKDMVRSGMFIRNSEAVDSINNGINIRSRGRIISDKHDG